MKEWETVIGLEIHVQLNTKSKLFSSAPNHFGDDPNTNITVVCTGQPGALPLLNHEALKKAVQFGLSVGATISPYSTFDRKSYFYPDSPRNYQITQFLNPIVIGGSLIADVDGVEKTFQIHHAHLEDDAGMLKHFSHAAAIDYNRAGAPLIEIVSEPCMHSAKEASAYAKGIKAIFQYIDASECNMEEGHLRMDVNISVRPKGEKGLRTKVEIKNMNSFNFLELAVDAEVKRQIFLYEKHADKPHGQVIAQGTYRWDLDKKQTVLMRTKENADDYRYFPEPDLAPIVLTKEDIALLRKTLPELPYDRKKRYIETYGLSADNAFLLTLDKREADYFEEALAVAKDAKALSNWILTEFAGRMKDTQMTLFDLPAKHIGKLVLLINEGKITGKIGKSVADDMILHPQKDPEEIVKENPNYQPLDDTGAIEKIVDAVLAENPQSVEDFKNGKTKAFAFLVGQVMKQTKGKASPDIVNRLLQEKIRIIG